MACLYVQLIVTGLLVEVRGIRRANGNVFDEARVGKLLGDHVHLLVDVAHLCVCDCVRSQFDI